MKKTTELSTKTEEENAFLHYQKRIIMKKIDDELKYQFLMIY